VKRARFAFTSTPHGYGCRRSPAGGRAVSLPRSLALRPRLATGLPWTVQRPRTVLVRWRHRHPGRSAHH
jgi:hypothetical protein